jgi:hypothetical protein
LETIMKKFLALTALALTALALTLAACTVPAVVQVQPAPVVIAAPAPVVTVPPVIPASLPTGPLVTLDSSAVTVTLAANVLTIQLAPSMTGTWLRLTLPDGSESGITDNGACHCIGLGRASAHLLNVSFLAGLSVFTSPSLDGPWTLAAKTQ